MRILTPIFLEWQQSNEDIKEVLYTLGTSAISMNHQSKRGADCDESNSSNLINLINNQVNSLNTQIDSNCLNPTALLQSNTDHTPENLKLTEIDENSMTRHAAPDKREFKALSPNAILNRDNIPSKLLSKSKLRSKSSTKSIRSPMKNVFKNTNLPKPVKKSKKSTIVDESRSERKKQKIETDLQSFSQEQIKLYDTLEFDYTCGVISTRKNVCRRNIACKVHTYAQKLLVKRSKPLQHILADEAANPKKFRDMRVKVKKYFNYKKSMCLEGLVYDREISDENHHTVECYYNDAKHTVYNNLMNESIIASLARDKAAQEASNLVNLVVNNTDILSDPINLSQLDSFELSDILRPIASKSETMSNHLPLTESAGKYVETFLATESINKDVNSITKPSVQSIDKVINDISMVNHLNKQELDFEISNNFVDHNPKFHVNRSITKKHYLDELSKFPNTRVIETVCYLHYKLKNLTDADIDDRAEEIVKKFPEKIESINEIFSNT